MIGPGNVTPVTSHTSKQADTAPWGEKKVQKTNYRSIKRGRPANNNSGSEYVKFSTFSDVTDPMSQFDLNS